MTIKTQRRLVEDPRPLEEQVTKGQLAQCMGDLAQCEVERGRDPAEAHAQKYCAGMVSFTCSTQVLRNVKLGEAIEASCRYSYHL